MSPETQTLETPANLQIPPHLASDSYSEAIVETPTMDPPRFVVFIGNQLAPQWTRLPFFRLGGKIYPELKTVPNCYLPRCAIMRLQTGYNEVNIALVEKEQRKHYIRTFLRTNVFNPVTGKRETVRVGGVPGVSSHLLFKEVPPRNEIGKIVGPRNGAVEIPVSSDDEKKEAQNFYFPNWARIIGGLDQLPRTLRELEDHLRNRQAKTLSAEMRAVGEAFLTGCADYRMWAMDYIKRQHEAIRDAEKVPGAFQTFSIEAELLFEECEIARPDNMTENFSRNMAGQATTQEKLAEIAERQAQSQEMLTKTLIAFMANQGLKIPEGMDIFGQMAAQTTSAPTAEPVRTNAPLPDPTESGSIVHETARTCGMSGGKDGKCTQTVLDAKGRCRHHPVEKEEAETA